jgi:hypothetical protein
MRRLATASEIANLVLEQLKERRCYELRDVIRETRKKAPGKTHRGYVEWVIGGLVQNQELEWAEGYVRRARNVPGKDQPPGVIVTGVAPFHSVMPIKQ